MSESTGFGPIAALMGVIGAGSAALTTSFDEVTSAATSSDSASSIISSNHSLTDTLNVIFKPSEDSGMWSGEPPAETRIVTFDDLKASPELVYDLSRDEQCSIARYSTCGNQKLQTCESKQVKVIELAREACPDHSRRMMTAESADNQPSKGGFL